MKQAVEDAQKKEKDVEEESEVERIAELRRKGRAKGLYTCYYIHYSNMRLSIYLCVLCVSGRSEVPRTIVDWYWY